MSEFVNPEREAFKAFALNKSDTPIHMLNLVKLNDIANYDDGAMVTGKEAYAAYGRNSATVFQRVGGRIIWSGNYENTLIGPSDEEWDIAFIAEYPDSDAFIEMVKDDRMCFIFVTNCHATKKHQFVRHLTKLMYCLWIHCPAFLRAGINAFFLK